MSHQEAASAMLPERHLRTALPVVVVAMLGVVAGYQARGINQLLAASVTDPEPLAPWLPVVDVLPSAPPSGDGVLARNAFDSETGSLLDPALPDTAPPDTAPPGAASLAAPAEDDPACDFGRVVLISAAEDATQSFAAIQRSAGDTALFRPGDALEGRTVAVIDWDRVWLRDSDRHCQLKLGMPAASASKGKQGAPKAAGLGRPSARALAPRLASKIERVSATELRVERSLLEELLADPAALNGLARAVPPRPGEQGVKLMGVRAESLLGHLGLQDGDRVESVNGFDVSEPRALLQAYGRLPQAETISVQLQRAGKPLSITIRIH